METLKEYRCKNCRKVLFFGEIAEGKVSKDCPRCGERNIVKVEKIVTTQVTIVTVKKTNELFNTKKIYIDRPVMAYR